MSSHILSGTDQNESLPDSEIFSTRSVSTNDGGPIPISYGIVGQSPELAMVLKRVRKIARYYRNVLVVGPTGSGKELVARALHTLSPVGTQKLAVCNSSALVDTLLESQLFGHVRGAFTGATDTRQGLFEYANGGALFLDEIGEMSLGMQAKLLRAIENREIQRVGLPEVRKVDVRVIAATNRDLQEEVRAGRFRKDLFYRLSTFVIRLPSLAERSGDIPPLVEFFLKRTNEQYGKSVQGLTDRAMAVLLDHSWPGNVRELENVIVAGCVNTDSDRIDICDLPPHFQRTSLAGSTPGGDHRSGTLEDFKNQQIDHALELCGGNRVRAAEMLGIGRSTIYRRFKRAMPEGTDKTISQE